MNKTTAHRLINIVGFKYCLKANQAISRKTKITIVTYHSVSPNSHRYAITQRTFYRQIEFVKENYQIIRLNQIKDAFAETGKKARKVIITFDDAFSNFPEFAYPILEKFSVPCTIFVPTGYIGKYNEWDFEKSLLPKISLMDKKQLLMLSKSGLVDFGSHAINHVSMGNLSIEEIKRQAIDSKKDLGDLLGFPINMFAYPHGQLGDVSKVTTKILSETGYNTAVTTRWGTLQSPQKILELKRIFFDEQDDCEDLKDKIEGLYDWFALKERIGFVLRFAEKNLRL